jgi:hypothetical protein
MHVARGGTVAVDDDVEVRGPITVAPGEALAIVSLNGNVLIQDNEEIDAYLVACNGQVLPSPAGMDVRGGVAARGFDPRLWMGGRGVRRIVYDDRVDPAFTEARLNQFRVHLGEERQVLLERR